MSKFVANRTPHKKWNFPKFLERRKQHKQDVQKKKKKEHQRRNKWKWNKHLLFLFLIAQTDSIMFKIIAIMYSIIYIYVYIYAHKLTEWQQLYKDRRKELKLLCYYKIVTL